MGIKNVTGFLKKQTKHSKLFYQYLLPYILILLIPLLLFSAFISGYVLEILKEEIHINNMNTLQNAKEVVESQLQDITSVEHKVYLNKMLGEFKMQETMRAVDAKEKLEAYCQINPFLVEVAFYQENSDYIIAASSSCPKKDFWSIMYSYEEWNFEEFQKDLEENEGFFFVKAQNVRIKGKNDQRLVTVAVPLDASANRCVILLLDENFFTSVLPQVDQQQELSAIIDDKGSALVSSGLLEIPEEKRKSSEKVESERFEIVELGGREFLWSHVYSEEFQWSYESFALLNNIENKVVSVRLLVLFLCLLICVAGTIAIIYFMNKNYVPLHTLGVVSGDILKNEENINEIDHIEKVLKYLDRQNQRLKTDEENRRENLRERFLLKWVTGEYTEKLQLEAQAEKTGIKLQRDLYMAAILCIYRDKIEEKQRALEILRNELGTDADVLVGLQTGAAKTMLVLGYDQEKSARIEEVLLLCENLFKYDGCLALGNPTMNTMELKNSYAEALSALEYRIIIEDQKIIRYEETKSWRGNDALDFNFGQLERFIKSKDDIGLEEFLAHFRQEMKQRKLDIRLIHKLCNELIYALEKAIANVNRDYFAEKPLYNNITGILEYDRVSELNEMIQLIARDLMFYLEKQSDQSIKEQMLAYISENAFSTDFSTTDMADKFGMSLSYLSRCFKEHVGTNMSDYVTELRVDRAKDLLRCEGSSVKAVAEEIGYCSVNSFIRRFKQVSGYTPGEWKKLK